MKTAFWLAVATTVVAAGSGVGLHVHDSKLIEQLTAQRDSTSAVFNRQMAEWESVNMAYRAAVLKAQLAYANGSRDDEVIFQAGVSFGAYLERYVQEMSMGRDHWDTLLDE